MSAPRLRAAAGLVVALAVLALSGPAIAARSDAKAIWGPLTRDGQSEFPLYHAMGVGIYEDDLSWAAVAPTRPRHATDPNDPAYQWPSDLDYALSQAASYHMRVLLLAMGTPPWANGGRASSYPPTRAADLANFLTAASRRYPAVHLWMIWGEPSRRPNFAIVKRASPNARRLTAAQARAPHVYAQLLDASYGALKRVSKRNLVIGGNTYTTGDVSTQLWIENMRLPNGRPPRMDMYGHNPFSFRHPSLSNPPSPDHEVDFSDLGRLEQLVDRNLAAPHQRLKLFLSEWTIPTSSHDKEFNFYVFPSVQAQWITDAWRIVRRSGFIYALGWIHLYDDPVGGATSGGLFYSDGRPKPGYYAFKNG